VAFQRGIDGSEPATPEGAGREAGRLEIRRTQLAGHLGFGTLACPGCDAPVVPAGVMSPSDPLGCGFCRHAGPLRDFLSLEPPTRPTRVVVRVVPR
jgi:hypothetical protein